MQTAVELVQKIVSLAPTAGVLIGTGQTVRNEMPALHAFSIPIRKVILLALGAVMTRHTFETVGKNVGA